MFMLWHRFGKNLGLILMGLVTGFVLTLVLGFADSPTGAHRETPQSTYGDLRIITVPLDRDDARDSMVIYKGDVPIIHLFRTDSNEVNLFGINNSVHGKLALGCLTKAGISEFTLFGNKVREGMQMPVFTMNASDKPGVWNKVRYTPTVAGIYDKGKLVSYRVVGEVYHDIDFDGQFDAKSIYDEKLVVCSESIFIDGQWLELGYREPNGRWKREGFFEADKSRAYTMDGAKKVYFDFVWGKGWHRRPEGDVPKSHQKARE